MRRRRFRRRRRGDTGPRTGRFTSRMQPFAANPGQLRTLMPAKFKTVLRFALNSGAAHILTSTSGAISSDYVYHANDLYDPYAGVGGQQPMGFDQLMALYRNFTVIGSKIYVNFYFNDSAGANHTMRCAVIMNDAAASVSSIYKLVEDPRSTQKILAAIGDHPLLLTNSFSVKKFFRESNPLDEDDLAGSSGASPVSLAYYHIVAYCPTGETQDVNIDGFIDYITVFHGPITPAQS